MSDPLRSGAIFNVDPNDPALRSPVPRTKPGAVRGMAAPSQLHRPSPQRPAGSTTRQSFEELYRQSPMPKVIAGTRTVRPSPSPSHRAASLPSVPTFDAAPSPRGGGANRGGAAAPRSPARPRSIPAKPSRRSQTKVTTLTQWSVEPAAGSEQGTFAVRGVDAAAAAAAPRVSSPIAVRTGPRQVMTDSENIYKLDGPPEDGAMEPATEKAFAKGLPRDWKDVMAGGAPSAPVDDVVPDSDSDTEEAGAPAWAAPGSASKSGGSARKPSRPRATPPTEADAKAKARSIVAAQANAARAAQAAAASQQQDAVADVMSSFDDVDGDDGGSARKRSSRLSRGEPRDYRAMSGKSPVKASGEKEDEDDDDEEEVAAAAAPSARRKSQILSKSTGEVLFPAPAPAPKPRRQSNAALDRAAVKASKEAEAAATAADVMKLDEMPVTSSGRRRVPPLPFWANSTIRRDREFNVLSATSGREVRLQSSLQLDF